jgi:hypothetical protein
MCLLLLSFANLSVGSAIIYLIGVSDWEGSNTARIDNKWAWRTSVKGIIP